MRSVFFHLIHATREEVARRLSTIAVVNGVNRWRQPHGPVPQVLQISFYEDTTGETPDEYLDILETALGRLPDVCVMVSVTGGEGTGDAEIRELAAWVLHSFTGVATDDNTSHCWTLEEIQSAATQEGRVFFG